MGIVEAGLPAGAGLLIASYYRKKELSLRFAMFFAFGQSGSCFSGVSIQTDESYQPELTRDSSSHMQSWTSMGRSESQAGNGKFDSMLQ